MPNIGESFGSSFTGASSSLLKPTANVLQKSPELVANIKSIETVNDNEEVKAGTSKQAEESKAPIGLYEELLASSTAYGDSWDEQDDASMLAQVIALSQQEFLDNLKKSPR